MTNNFYHYCSGDLYHWIDTRCHTTQVSDNWGAIQDRFYKQPLSASPPRLGDWHVIVLCEIERALQATCVVNNSDWHEINFCLSETNEFVIWANFTDFEYFLFHPDTDLCGDMAWYCDREIVVSYCWQANRADGRRGQKCFITAHWRNLNYPELRSWSRTRLIQNAISVLLFDMSSLSDPLFFIFHLATPIIA